LFLHSGITKEYGFDGENGVYEAVGSLDQSMSYIDISDIARAIAFSAEKVMEGETVPESLRIAGTHGSFCEIASVMNQAGAGARDVEMKSVDRAKFRTRAPGRNMRGEMLLSV
jgi:hypothetical protein